MVAICDDCVDESSWGFLDKAWGVFNHASQKTAAFLKASSTKITAVAITALSILTSFFETAPFLIGFGVSYVINVIDIALGDRFSNWAGQFCPDNPTQNIAMGAALGLITQAIAPEAFGFGLGAYVGRKAAELSIETFRYARSFV